MEHVPGVAFWGVTVTSKLFMCQIYEIKIRCEAKRMEKLEKENDTH